MYTVMIVEDEPLERMALRALLERDYAQVGGIWEAASGDQALEMARRLCPDVLLVDINIPGLTGLDLVRALSGEGYAGRFVITTAHERFGYAVEAMDLGCVAYLLKPIQDDQLKRALGKCFKAVNAQHSVETMMSALDRAGEYLIRDILNGAADFSTLEKVYRWPGDGRLSAYVVCLSSPDPALTGALADALSARLKKAFSAIVSPLGRNVIAFVQPQEEMEPALAQLALWCIVTIVSSLPACAGTSIQVAGPKTSLQALCDAYGSLGHRHSGGWSPGSAGMPASRRRLIRQRVVQRLREGRADRAALILDKVKKDAGLWQTWRVLIEALQAYDLSLPVDGALDAMLNLDAPDQYLRSLESRLSSGSEVDQSAIDTAMAILRARFDQPLSQAQVAEEVGLSQAYFSRLFKQKAGKNFVDVLQAVRLERARALIDAGARDLGEVARQCGYASVKYFASAFKRVTGMSPARYRERAIG